MTLDELIELRGHAASPARPDEVTLRELLKRKGHGSAITLANELGVRHGAVLRWSSRGAKVTALGHIISGSTQPRLLADMGKPLDPEELVK